MFKTFEALVKFFDKHSNLRAVESFLYRSIMEETKTESSESRAVVWANEKKLDNLDEIDLTDAQEDFLTDINKFIKDPKPINHWTIILNRRKYKAWAIAQAILEETEK